MRRKGFISAASLAAAVLSAVLSVPAQGLFPLLSETGSYGRTIVVMIRPACWISTAPVTE